MSNLMPQRKGKIYGVGLGPGDPSLMSVEADRLVRNAKNLAFFRKSGRQGHARTIVEKLVSKGTTEIAMEYPVTTEIPTKDPRYKKILSLFYQECTEKIKNLTEKGEDVCILCEGDPFFFGSFMHLYTRLKADHVVEVIPGITGMSGAWSATTEPITWGDDVLTVLVGTLREEELTHHMSDTGALVVMKVGQNFEKICLALKKTNLYHRAWLIEYATMGKQKVAKLTNIKRKEVPYFSIIMVPGQGRRP